MNKIHLYWLLTSHIFGLFPVVVTYLEFKRHKRYQSLYMFFNYLSNILFSILYDTRDYSEINEPIQSTNDLWILLLKSLLSFLFELFNNMAVFLLLLQKLLCNLLDKSLYFLSDVYT